MTPDAIAHLRRLLAAATPGRWHVSDDVLVSVSAGDCGDPPEEHNDCTRIAETDGNDRDRANAALIAALVNAAPDLLRRIEEVDNCICWGVDCPHIATGLDLAYGQHVDLEAKLAAAEERAAKAEAALGRIAELSHQPDCTFEYERPPNAGEWKRNPDCECWIWDGQCCRGPDICWKCGALSR